MIVTSTGESVGVAETVGVVDGDLEVSDVRAEHPAEKAASKSNGSKDRYILTIAQFKEGSNGGVDAGERQHEPTESTKQVEKQAIEPRVQRFVMPRSMPAILSSYLFSLRFEYLNKPTMPPDIPSGQVNVKHFFPLEIPIDFRFVGNKQGAVDAKRATGRNGERREINTTVECISDGDH